MPEDRCVSVKASVTEYWGFTIFFAKDTILKVAIHHMLIAF